MKTTELDIYCERCGKQATWGSSLDPNQLYIFGPKNDYVLARLALTGHHCRICRNEIFEKRKKLLAEASASGFQSD